MTTPVRLSSQNHLFTPKPQRISASLTSANRILRRYSIPIRLKTLSDCTPTLWIILYEAIFDIRIPEIKRQASDFADHIFNLERILKRLEKEVLEAELPHLKPQLICSGDEDSILDLLEIFVEIVKLLDSQLLNSTEEKSSNRDTSLETTGTLSDLTFSSDLSSTQIREILKRYIDELTDDNPDDSLLESRWKALMESSGSSSQSGLPSFSHQLVSSTPISRSSGLSNSRVSSFLSENSEDDTTSLRSSRSGSFSRHTSGSERRSGTDRWSSGDGNTEESFQYQPASSGVNPVANSPSTDSYILDEIERLIERARDGEKISETSKLETILEYLRQEGIEMPSSNLSLSTSEDENISSASQHEPSKSYRTSSRAQSKSVADTTDHLGGSEKSELPIDTSGEHLDGHRSSRIRGDLDEGYGTNSKAFSNVHPSAQSTTEADVKPDVSIDRSFSQSLHTNGSLPRDSRSVYDTSEENTSYDDEQYRILMPKPYATSPKKQSTSKSSKSSRESLGSDYLRDQLESIRRRRQEEKRIPLRKPGERLRVRDDIEEFLTEHGEECNKPSVSKSKNRDAPLPAQLLPTPDDSAYVKKLKEKRREILRKSKSQAHPPQDILHDTLADNEEYFRKLTCRGGTESQNTRSTREAELLKQTKKRIEQENRAAIIKLNQMTKLYAKQSICDRKSRLARLRKEKDNIDQQALSLENRIQSEESKTLNSLFLTTLKLQKSAIAEARREHQMDMKQREGLRKENQKALEALLKSQLADAEKEAREERADSGIKTQKILESMRELQKNQFAHVFEKLRGSNDDPSEYV
ncbi:hypothetical protein K493DRAFT_77011 [Basidiobolus meristosporus CBS 931.73]|uniref:DUF5745 domain-containing protein n=1 Tax=Basidiobolus meristosporus CBS 931.73 TaxID=1314790 RepID=A0A1Y1XTG0_9FUNG|nr:hypothetical protein K493DRAFT_77011 [Basidiobolus meristosporus CBS 931.73]|eukprot:ORX88584.1 hypothetical protein K493DRAFT_77011 [Basidiobolus meristosporus CBS 931.73]